MTSINEFKNYSGSDANLEISLFEQGLIWKFNEVDSDYHFIYKINDNLFDSGCIGSIEELDWIDLKKIMSFTGLSLSEWIDSPLYYQVADIISYYGFECVFGSSYGSEFKIKENEEYLKDFN